MGKESDLLKAVKEKDTSKIQKLLSSTSKRSKDESLSWKSVDSSNQMRVELRHIDVNTREKSTGFTPLSLAVLNGMKSTAERLIFNCADVNALDDNGNTPLHLAAFGGHLDLVELLLQNEAEVNSQNSDGNTALHLASENYSHAQIKIIRTLVKAGANVWTQNKHELTPLDLGARFKRDGAVTALLEYAPTLVSNRVAIVDAAIRGHYSTVEILLEHGVSPNLLDDHHGSYPLHEALRYNRLDVVELLLCFQADQELINPRKESPLSLARLLRPHTQHQVLELLKDQYKKTPRFPTKLDHTDSPRTPDRTTPPGHIKNYPKLPNDISWTQNRPLFCNSCTERNPNSHILDDNLRTFWVVPVLHDAWTIFDLQSEHIITGVTIFGWNSPQMIRTFQIQVADSLQGPWTVVTSHTCQRLGSSDPKEEAFPQDFFGFTFRSRYLRLYLVDNHEGSHMCFQGIQFHGADCLVVDTLQACQLSPITDAVILQGLNTWKKFLDITPEQVYELVSDAAKKASLLEALYKGRKEMYPMTVLSWVVPPATTVFVGEALPDFSVQSDPGVTEVIQLIVQGGQVSGDTCRRLIPGPDGNPSTATFSNVVIQPAGLYSILVQGINTNITLMCPKPVEVRPEVRSENDISSAFDEIQQMLSEMQAAIPDPK